MSEPLNGHLELRDRRTGETVGGVVHLLSEQATASELATSRKGATEHVAATPLHAFQVIGFSSP